jgi:cyclopropane-fatty-acyl-phospholipid synthase
MVEAAVSESRLDATKASLSVVKSMRDAPFHVRLALRRLLSLQHGDLTIEFPSGRRLRFEGRNPGPTGFIQVHDFGFARKALARGDIGFAEGYMDGDWETHDLASLLELFSLNLDGLVGVIAGGPLARFVLALQHRFNANSKKQARRNIAAHYDLGNDFYAEWLDPSMTYSSALYERSGMPLEEAQKAKYRALAEAIGLQPGEKVLEIGCGWGGFASMACSEFDAELHGLTLSVEQKAWAENSLNDKGLSDKFDIRLQDYRDEKGRYDRVASIEMIEAVGEEYWPAYFGKIAEVLKPGGRAGIQAISIREDLFDSYRNRADFIQKYIFPGGMLITKPALRDQAEKAGMKLVDMRCFAVDYADTLREWDERFCAAWDRIAEMGFDERFKRMWRFYLNYCEAGFRTGRIDVGQYVLEKRA